MSSLARYFLTLSAIRGLLTGGVSSTRRRVSHVTGEVFWSIHLCNASGSLASGRESYCIFFKSPNGTSRDSPIFLHSYAMSDKTCVKSLILGDFLRISRMLCANVRGKKDFNYNDTSSKHNWPLFNMRIALYTDWLLLIQHLLLRNTILHFVLVYVSTRK